MSRDVLLAEGSLLPHRACRRLMQIDQAHHIHPALASHFRGQRRAMLPSAGCTSSTDYRYDSASYCRYLMPL